MLVLSRKAGESIYIGDHITITLVRVGPGQVRVGIEAPDEVPIVRGELETRSQESGGRSQAGEALAVDRLGLPGRAGQRPADLLVRKDL